MEFHDHEDAPATSALDGVFGTRLSETRRRLGLTQDQIARAMTLRGFDFTQATVHKIEKTQQPRKVSVGEAIALAEILGVDLSVLTAADGQDKVTLLEEMRQCARGILDCAWRIDVLKSKSWSLMVELETVIDTFEEIYDSGTETSFREVVATPREFYGEIVHLAKSIQRIDFKSELHDFTKIATYVGNYTGVAEQRDASL